MASSSTVSFGVFDAQHTTKIMTTGAMNATKDYAPNV